ncbi:hypothetical protein BDW02DRAFT_570775 [Decorospora gaudefroyi]|uniref:Uncharacterized protein n=1 Tax=Decorospora gaudefroyi TaxID=184978 RepID=A0A6A5KH21_9PLEO|nr:hypothetical protein BDW02DRAFT_570775 [Decorospora gaudefroyi]
MSDTPASTAAPEIIITAEPDVDAEERGRLKRRRQSSLHSPRRASSPSRGHERNSGSRYREHHRKHHRPSSPGSSISPPKSIEKKMRRRSDAEPDHTFRGRARNRSSSRGRTRSPILEGEDVAVGSDEEVTRYRKRSAPPSRHRADDGRKDEGVRRQRSYPNLYKEDRRDSKGGPEEVEMHGEDVVDSLEVVDKAPPV